jgi:hypothetical protein
VLANGFSCREQIEQLRGRKAEHIADVPSTPCHFDVITEFACPLASIVEQLARASANHTHPICDLSGFALRKKRTQQIPAAKMGIGDAG